VKEMFDFDEFITAEEINEEYTSWFADDSSSDPTVTEIPLEDSEIEKKIK
jgi:hypothetical protein